ncbi:hypothetical protein EXA21_15280 [Vibrio cincinnatiensis]|nr:hypothetical protein [Vibrio cincinnatiensis]MCG3764156.1 hypothetical protein [Vibrio cincinnatiensis]
MCHFGTQAYKHLRGTINAWHFGFGWHLRLRLVSLSSAVCVACPLMRRYVTEYPTFSRHFTKLDLGSN